MPSLITALFTGTTLKILQGRGVMENSVILCHLNGKTEIVRRTDSTEGLGLPELLVLNLLDVAT